MADVSKPEFTHAERVMHESYAVDEKNEQVTVMGTMGQDPTKRQHIDAKSWVVIIVCALATCQGIIGAIAAGSNQFAITGALGHMELRTWLVQGAAIPGIVTGPLLGIASDIYGRRWIVLSCWILALVSSIVGATAHTTPVVIGANLIAGFQNGVSGLMFSIVSETVPRMYRTAFQTMLIVVSSISSVIALMGIGQAVIADPINGWRWQYYILAIFNVFIITGFFFAYHPPTRTPEGRKPLMEQIKGNDWIGYFLLCAGLVPFVLGFTYAGTSYGWSDPHAYANVAVGSVFLVACGLYEWKGTSHGFLDHRLFRRGRNFPLTCFLLAVEGSLFYLMNNIYTEEVATLWNDGTIKTSAYYLPYFLCSLPVAPIMAYYCRKTGDLRNPLVAGFVLFFASMFGFAFCGNNRHVALAFNAIAGVGFTAPLILLISLAQLSTPPLLIGVASALAITCRTLGGVVALAIATAVYGSKTNSQAPAAIAKAAIESGVAPENVGDVIVAFLSHNFAGLAQIPGVTGRSIGAIVEAANAVYIQGFKLVWLVFVPGGALAVLCCFFIFNPSDHLVWVTDAPLDASKVVSAEHAASDDISSEDKV